MAMKQGLVETLLQGADLRAHGGWSHVQCFRSPGKAQVACHSFEQDWPSWEIHPAGEELVCLMSGAATLVLEQQNGERTIELTQPGAYVVVPRDIWHAAGTKSPCTMLFITPGEGTENRPL